MKLQRLIQEKKLCKHEAFIAFASIQHSASTRETYDQEIKTLLKYTQDHKKVSQIQRPSCLQMCKYLTEVTSCFDSSEQTVCEKVISYLQKNEQILDFRQSRLLNSHYGLEDISQWKPRFFGQSEKKSEDFLMHFYLNPSRQKELHILKLLQKEEKTCTFKGGNPMP